MSPDSPQSYDLDELKQRVRGPEPRFFEFLRSPGLSGALYRLPAGSNDLQGPHLEDEVYLVIEGRARLRVGGEDRDVRPGLVLFIPANVRHAFVEIAEDLTLLALFSATDRPYDT
ncbi:MAG: cupin domain-containing protein [Gammaproteobacteria bacterium]|nr:cupin domain-containing protein [Gammaproteobacteria bacterium]